MDRFVSHFTNRLDAKGRVSIPAPFRAVLARDGFDGLYLNPSLDQPALDCGGHALLREIDGLIERFAPYSQEREYFAAALMGTSEILKVDPEGRIMLGETLKAYAGIADQAVFVGVGTKFQIWEPERFQRHLSEAKEQVRRLRTALGASGAPERGPPSAPRGARE